MFYVREQVGWSRADFAANAIFVSWKSTVHLARLNNWTFADELKDGSVLWRAAKCLVGHIGWGDVFELHSVNGV